MTFRLRSRRLEPGGPAPASAWHTADALGGLRRYVVAGIAYVVLGLLVKQVMAWWTYGMIFLLLALWTLPALRERRKPRRAP